MVGQELAAPREQHLPHWACAAKPMLDARPRLLDGRPIEKNPHISRVGLAKNSGDDLVADLLFPSFDHSSHLSDRHAEVPKKIGNRVRLEEVIGGRR
jgi:hypothetical protein